MADKLLPLQWTSGGALGTRTLLLIIAFSGLVACDSGSMNVEEPQTPMEPVEPRMPGSLSDCTDDSVFAEQVPMRLLTRYEYDNTIRDLFGIQTRIARDSFPKENAVAGFENNSDSHKVNPLMMRELMTAAETLAPEGRQFLLSKISCQSKDSACGQEVLDHLLPRAFRRPLSKDERAIFDTLFEDQFALDGFDSAIDRVIEATLLSPQFLYRIELNENRAPGDLVAVDSWEMASRLSYFLWGSMPDEELLQSALDGKLSDPEEIESQTRRMIADPKAGDLIFEFYRQWLGLGALDTMVKDGAQYPEWNESVSAAWKASLRAFIDDVHQNRPTVEALLTSTTLHLNAELAPVYGMQADGTGMTGVQMPEDQRAGLLTHPSVMALLAYPSQSSPIHRGIFVRERLLCQKLPSPPDNLEIEPPDPNPTATTREIFQQHSADPSCSACHRLIDPIGLGFENYDSLGRFRTTEHGFEVDASGALTNTADRSLEQEFYGAVELADILKDAQEVNDCIADHWFTFAKGHPEKQADMCSAEAIREEFNRSGGNFDDLLVAITTSDAFRFRTLQVQGETP